mmetsp:Transcript_65701/g.182895  ORF Transcript_65701/g.182895 Transcript_65701/m.182895 type:complete len:227 (-) Transcript_65701:731-1411(-)
MAPRTPPISSSCRRSREQMSTSDLSTTGGVLRKWGCRSTSRPCARSRACPRTTPSSCLRARSRSAAASGILPATSPAPSRAASCLAAAKASLEEAQSVARALGYQLAPRLRSWSSTSGASEAWRASRRPACSCRMTPSVRWAASRRTTPRSSSSSSPTAPQGASGTLRITSSPRLPAASCRGALEVAFPRATSARAPVPAASILPVVDSPWRTSAQAWLPQAAGRH